MKKQILQVTTNIENMKTVMSFVDEHLQCLENPKIGKQLMLAAEELAVNVFNYAYEGRTGDFTLSITNDTEKQQIILEFRDSGKDYNPLLLKEPDTPQDINSRKIGGLGVMMARKLTDEQFYRREMGEKTAKAKGAKQKIKGGVSAEIMAIFEMTGFFDYHLS